MSIEKLKRVLSRARARNPGQKTIRRGEFQKCIMIECGTSPMTYYNNKKAMVKLGWIESRKYTIRITDLDLTEDYL